MVDHLVGLNPKQKEAATYLQGPLLIMAGAGAGKTKTIIARINELISQGISPENILAVTFTNKAAGEMRNRLRFIKGTGQMPFIGTFHSLGVHLLRADAGKIGLKRHFNILDRHESITRLKGAMSEAGIDPKQWEPKKILGAISAAKGRGQSVNDYEQASSIDYRARLIAQIWHRYENLLNQAGALDFDDLLLKSLQLLQKEPEVLARHQKHWQYIHIDEYQDTNQIQYRLSRLLSAGRNNICVVGDVDQSIYSWRGADFTNILNFEEDYPTAKTVLLEENYRSSGNIIGAANAIIKKNSKRREKNLFTANPAGDKLGLYAALDEADEARFIAHQTKSLIADGLPPNEIAVLYRANFQSRILEEAFLAESLPYQVLGVRFFERQEVKDVLAYIKAALNQTDFESIKRIINKPRRGIGKVTLLKIAAGEESSLPATVRQKIDQFRNILHRIEKHITANTLTVSQLIKFVIDHSGLLDQLKKEGDDGLERIENIKELVTLAGKYDNFPTADGVADLLAEMALLSDQDTMQSDRPNVRLMTVHAAKGLEFDAVFVTGLEEGLFPHQMMGNDSDRDEEEERRLFYVAITRARRKLFLSYAQVRTIYGSRQTNLPSEFLIDLPEEYLTALPSIEESVII